MAPNSACLPHILLIEDDAAWARLLTVGLEERGRIEWARSLDAARRLLEDRSYDLVVSDLRLGGSDAQPLLSELRRGGRHPRILLVSGHGDLAAIAAESRADAWLAKPVRLKDLRAVVDGLLVPAPPLSAAHALHSMKVFDSDEERIASAATFAAEGLLKGDRTVVVVMDRIHDRVAERIRRLAGAAATPVFAAAESIGARVLRDGLPSRALLRDLAAPLLNASDDPRPISFYGEGVDALASRGQHRAALQLERLWNEILPPSGVRMLCGYSRAGLAGAPCGCLGDLEAEHDAGR